MGKGNIKIQLNGSMQTITGVFYVPELKSNLISLGQLQEKGFTILIQKDNCQIHHPEKGLFAQAQMTTNWMFPLYTQIPHDDQTCFTSTTQDTTWLWHYRYGHLNFNGLKTLEQKKMVN